MGFRDYDSTPGNNTSINGINIQGSADVLNFDDALRQYMADAKDFSLLTFTSKAVQVLTSGTTYTPDAAVVAFDVIAIGGGGGGGGADGQGAGTAGVGVPGTGGGTVITYGVTPSGSYTYAIGAAGTGGAAGANNGTDGGDTTFSGSGLTSITAGGGTGGGGRTASSGTTRAFNAVGGTATGGDVNIAGWSGAWSIVSGGSFISFANGADHLYGSGGEGVTNNNNGGDATGFGAGGGGACVEDTSVDRAGGAGATGAIIIIEYRND